MTKADDQKPKVILRRLSLGINVSRADELPKVSRHLDAFVKRIDHAHGPFDLDMAVSVNPLRAEQAAEHPRESDLPEQEFEIIVINGDDDEMEVD